MMTSLTTFERDLRERLLDVLYGQWHDLGVPFSGAPHPDSTEVIDPEALLWCALEFFPTEPRLREGVDAWLHAHRNYVIRQRVNRLARNGEPRTNIWHAVDQTKGPRPELPTEPSYGLGSADEVADFCERLASDRLRLGKPDARTGKPVGRPSTVLLQARDLLGNDIRHFLLVYLLASPSGGKLKTIQRWSGYSYRSISETARRWESADVLSIDHGYCRLTHPEPWHVLSRHQVERAVIVDWFGVFEACVRLLRVLAKADRKGLTWDSSVVTSYCRDTDKALSSAVLNEPQGARPSVSHLHELLQNRTRDVPTVSGRKPTG